MTVRGGAGWAVWNGVLTLDTIGLLAVAIYAAMPASAEGPGATPLLMAGLLSLCTIVLALVGIVDGALWASAVRLRWAWRLALAVAPLVGAGLVFAMALHASDPGESTLSRRGALLLFVGSVLAADALNRAAVRRFRRRDRH